MKTTAIDWTERLQAAREAARGAGSVEEQTIRDAHAADVPATQIAAALGVKNRTRISDITSRDRDAAAPVALTPVVYLRGAGIGEDVWARVREAMAARGWATVSGRTAAWHLSRGGADVVMCDFSSRDVDDYVVIGRVQAKYRGDEMALELPGAGEEHPHWSYRRARPRCDAPDGRVGFMFGSVVQVTDAEQLARLVGDAFAGAGPDGW